MRVHAVLEVEYLDDKMQGRVDAIQKYPLRSGSFQVAGGGALGCRERKLTQESGGKKSIPAVRALSQLLCSQRATCTYFAARSAHSKLHLLLYVVQQSKISIHAIIVKLAGAGFESPMNAKVGLEFNT